MPVLGAFVSTAEMKISLATDACCFDAASFMFDAPQSGFTFYGH
jgi:hypothetical protein